MIPSAGLGTRLGEFSKNLNKAMLSLDNKPVISHLIEKFSKDIEIVIALGHKGDLLRDYLDIAHHDRKITYVEIENFSGPGSGLGLTILQCYKHLQCPFVFCPNDTVIIEDIPPPSTNWMGYAEVENNQNYRSLKVNSNNCIQKICEKEDLHATKTLPYIGLAGINDYREFWEKMQKGQSYGSIRVGESYGFREMLNSGTRIEAKKFTWYDTGNLESLKIAKENVRTNNAPEILEKPNEAIWFTNGKVIKYNASAAFIADRASRAKILKGYVPEIIDVRKNMYSYKMITGQTISKNNSFPVVQNLLRYLDDFWVPHELGKDEHRRFKEACLRFYKEKTEKRLQLYFDRIGEADSTECINGITIPPVTSLLASLDWEQLSSGLPVRFHGDLHFENILVAETGDFALLDWRQEFSGIKDYGDLYYDLAKLMHGLIVSHELINKDQYSIRQMDHIVTFDLHRKHSLVENQLQFNEYLRKKGLNAKKVRILTALIYLNIAALHHDPYSRLLFYLGKSMLYKEVSSD